MLQVDHATPAARGGDDDDANLVASCFDCNQGKRDRIVVPPTGTTFLGWLRAQKARDDIIGDLARDEERTRLIEPASFKHLSRQIRQALGSTLPSQLDGSPIFAAWHAWREHRRGGKPTLFIEKLRAHNEKAEQEARAKGTVAIWKLGELVE